MFIKHAKYGTLLTPSGKLKAALSGTSIYFQLILSIIHLIHVWISIIYSIRVNELPLVCVLY